MKIQVRRGVFETNSSNTHSLTICTADEYEKFRNNELYYDFGSLLTKEQVKEKYNRYKKAKWYRGETFDEWFENRIENGSYSTYDTFGSKYLEQFKEDFTTPSGDKMVAFGEFGYDG